MNVIRMLMPAGLALATAFAQTPAQHQEFEVISVKPADPIVAGTQQVNIGLHIDGAQVHLISASLRDLVRMAYQVKTYQVVGPEWLESERFSIDAKLPAGSTKEQVPEMLKSLLADRFHLKYHNESREFPVYVLEVNPGGKLKDVSDTAEALDAKAPTEVNAQGSAAGVSASLPGGASFTFADNKFVAHKIAMTSLADILSRFMDKPVVDMTGLPGRYEVSLSLSEDDYRGMLIRSAINAGVALPPEALRYLATISDTSLHGALRANGLKFENRKAPLPVVVVDSVLKTPTENQ
jgi:uncharacterized protein (TIGR03435 family)